MKLTFLFSHCPDPRVNKRIEVVKKTFETTLVYWNRTPHLALTTVHNDINNREIVIEGSGNNPLKRIIPTFKFALRAIKEIRKSKPQIIYTCNIDMLLIAWLSLFGKKGNVKLIYEIADLHKLVIDKPRNFKESVVQKIILVIERKLCKRIDLLVLTSEKFYDVYFSKFVPKEKMIFIPNMPDVSVFSNYKCKESGKFTVGFIGLVRYKEQMKMLLSAAGKCNINILFAGAEMDSEISNMCKNKEFVEYYGKYDYNKEISKLYGKVDCIYSVYDANLINVKVALPNKLYESIYCKLPIIVAKETYLAQMVESMGVGVAVSHTNETELVSVLKKLSSDRGYYQQLVKKCEIYSKQNNANIYNEALLRAIKELE